MYKVILLKPEEETLNIYFGSNCIYYNLPSSFLYFVIYFILVILISPLLKHPGMSQHPTTNNCLFHVSFPDSTGLSLCRRRSCTATSMTPTTRRLIVVAPTCGCIPTAWPCRTPRPRWQCSSSSAAACRRWPYPPPSTAIT